jgi:DNA-binding NarL/FixJ family response regulator
VKALGTSRRVDRALDPSGKLVLAYGPSSARLRITQALAARQNLTTRSAGSMQDLREWGPSTRQVVAYCETISAEQLEQLKLLKREAPDVLIVAVCESADRRSVRRLLDGGIDGFVFANQLEESLGPTVEAVFAGQTVVPRDLRDSVDRPSLSTRERQILGKVLIGLTNQEIGAQMFLAESTVKSHLSSAYNKLGVRSRSEAVAVILDRPDTLGTGIAAVAPKVELRAA